MAYRRFVKTLIIFFNKFINIDIYFIDEVTEEWKDTEIFKMLKKHVDEGNINK